MTVINAGAKVVVPQAPSVAVPVEGKSGRKSTTNVVKLSREKIVELLLEKKIGLLEAEAAADELSDIPMEVVFNGYGSARIRFVDPLRLYSINRQDYSSPAALPTGGLCQTISTKRNIA